MINNVSTSNMQNIFLKQKTQQSTEQFSDKSMNTFTKGDSFVVSDSTKLLNQISSFEKELDNIFGVPKELSKEELKKAEQLNNQIDKILGVDNIKLSKTDQKLMDKLDKQIDEIFKDDKVTKDEEKQLNSLIKRQDSILSNYERKELTKEEETKVEALFKELDALQGLKTPSEENLIKAEDIYSKLNEASNKLDKLTQSSDTQFVDIAKLLQQKNLFDKQLTDIFGKPKELNDNEKKIEESLNTEIEKILDSYEVKLSKSDQKIANSIEKEIDKILKDNTVTKEEEQQLQKLEKRMDKIYDNYEVGDISKKDEDKLDKLFKQMDELYGLKVPNKEQLLRAENIYTQLEKIEDKLGENSKKVN